LIGAGALAYEKNHHKVPLKELHRDTALAFLACVIWGFGFFMLDPVVSQISWQALIVTSEIVFTVIAAVLLLAVHGRDSYRLASKVAKSRTALLVGLAGASGLIALYFGSNKAGNIIIPAVLSSLAPLVASLWGALLDDEKIGLFKRAGAVILVGGIVLLNLA
jgi:drug/metabolite transporter (DMT)-like permease